MIYLGVFCSIIVNLIKIPGWLGRRPVGDTIWLSRAERAPGACEHDAAECLLSACCNIPT